MTGYDDIINLSRPASTRPKMSMHDRAAQFAPFAALNGHYESIEEAAEQERISYAVTCFIDDDGFEHVNLDGLSS